MIITVIIISVSDMSCYEL